jgi:hypothetical protein
MFIIFSVDIEPDKNSNDSDGAQSSGDESMHLSDHPKRAVKMTEKAR